MSLTRARKYHSVSRTVVPLAACYMAGFALGRAVYLASGRLGLVWGPLGAIRGAFLTSPARRPAASFDVWAEWIPLVVFGWLFMAEMTRQQGRRSSNRERLLLVGYVLMLASSSRVLLQQLPDGAYTCTSILTGAVLAGARWSEWRSGLRVAAAGIALGAAIVAIFVWRMTDSVRLG